jgi:hypothetical protein
MLTKTVKESVEWARMCNRMAVRGERLGLTVNAEWFRIQRDRYMSEARRIIGGAL